MKVLVAYMSRTGNTKKVAEAIFQEIQVEKEIKELEALTGLEGYDLYFVGFPIEAYGPAHPAKVLLEKHAKRKDIVLFTTHATPEDSEFLRQELEACRAAAAGANIVGLFNCQGELSEQLAEFMKSSGDPQWAAWSEVRPASLGQPDATRLQRARVFARKIMKKYSV